MFRSATKPYTLPGSGNAPASLFTQLSQWAARRRDRQMLARLDAHLLRDIGLTPDEAQAECGKPVWRP